MGRLPAVVIVARHGARLDAADIQWHLTSPSPYDPPLTYGGWRQSQALGARIASIVQNLEADLRTTNGSSKIDGDSVSKERHSHHHSHRGRRRKHKIVVHSSPFLRCIQTSIAISAGIAQYQGSSKTTGHQLHSKPHLMHSGSPHLQAMDDRNSPRLSAIPEPEFAGTPGGSNTPLELKKPLRTLMRVDAFLGEWMSPEYFDKITPPPGSKLMVASAKGELLRQGDPVDMLHTSKISVSSRGSLLWGGGAPSSKASSSDDDTPLSDMTSLSKNIPKLGRANSHSVGDPPSQSSMRLTHRVERIPSTADAFYVPLTPSYAVSPSQPIPQGYVAHARDACVKVDYQWDSLRPPLEWGHGGEYGEEWSNMHKRFRRGFYEMLTWYRNHESSETLEPMSDGSPQSQISQSTHNSQSPGGSDEDDVETVLVLVTHGAGCNALIGALTNQPVLIDVGMASLTVAVRKSVGYRRVASPASETPPSSPSRRRQSLFDLGISEDYEVKLVASTDHLRAGSAFLAGPRVQPQTREKSPYRYERPGFASTRVSTFGTITDDNSDSDDSNSASTRNHFGGVGRSDTVSAHSSGGLWSMPEPKKTVQDPKQSKEMPVSQNGEKQIFALDGASVEQNGHHLQQIKSEPTNGSHANGDHADAKLSNGISFNGRSVAPSNGLWGAPPQALGTERDIGPKRRWTLSQAS